MLTEGDGKEAHQRAFWLLDLQFSLHKGTGLKPIALSSVA